MFDMFNPALREAKRRAKEEYRQRLLQGKIDAAMRHAREKADNKLRTRERLRKDWPNMLVQAGGLLLALVVAIAIVGS